MIVPRERLAAYYKWRTRFLRPYEDGLYVVKESTRSYDNGLSCSNEHGLAMLAAVTCGQQADFDGLFKFYNRFRNKNGLMGFLQQMEQGKFIPAPWGGGSSSTEADVDIATSLFLAKNRWTSGGSCHEINYLEEAIDLARCIWEHCFDRKNFMPWIGDWCKSDDHEYNKVTKPGHFILGGYWILQKEDLARRERWKEVIERMVAVLQQQLTLHPKTGLLADYLVLADNGSYVPAKSRIENKERPDHCTEHSCKAPWRLAYYLSLTGDTRISNLLLAQGTFFMGQLSHGGIAPDYALDGIRTGKTKYFKSHAAPVRFLFGTLGWNDRYDEMIEKTKNAESGGDSMGYTIDLICTLQFNGKAVPHLLG
ncbi:hypothetical protein [Absidia glauca]|uniref:Uncharacterized protein n=1 Tax=Absidia glauca TaxID=4829 RepID=A0A163JGK2_ABSGL|nr:hypothetical protein [Absidia glauca]